MKKPPIEVTTEFIQPYWEGRKRHKNYFKTKNLAQHYSFHFDGYKYPWQATGGDVSRDLSDINPWFQNLIDSNRPGESDVIKMYRRQRYKALTQTPCNKVISSLRKIIKSPSWGIQYDEVNNPTSQPTEDSLYEYMEKHFPKDNSTTNWARKYLVRWMLLDPNSLICVFPLSFEIEASEYLRPYPHIVACRDMYDFKEDSFAVFLSPYVSEYPNKDGHTVEGKIIMVVTTESYWEARQISDDKFELVEYPHNLGELPCWIMGGESRTSNIVAPFYHSFIDPMLPYLDSMAIDSSDLDAEKVQHLYSTMWTTQSMSCSSCQGTGNVLALGKQTVCTSCEGLGHMPFSPYRTLEVNLNANGLDPAKQIPVPPAGYIEKSTDMVSKMIEIIDRSNYMALAAVNFEFLAEVPLATSGISKAYSSDELNNFVFGVAQHMVDILENIYYFTNELRYQTSVPDKKTRELMLPTIPCPETFDYLVRAGAVDELMKITTADVSEDLKELMEMNYVHGKFSEVPEVLNRLTIIQDMDPFPGKEPADLQALLTAGLIKKEDAVLSVYLKQFVAQLLSEGDKFVVLEFDEQKEILMEMAKDKLEEMSAEQAIKQQADADKKAQANVEAIRMAGGDPNALLTGAKKPIPNTAGVGVKIKDKQTQDPNTSKVKDDLRFS